MAFLRSSAIRLLSAIVVMLFCGQAVRSAPVSFDLPAQSAAAALVAFARQAGVEVLFAHRDLADVRSTEVTGRLEPEEALKLLLRGTGFTFLRNHAGKFVIVRETRHTLVRGTVVRDRTGEPVRGAVVTLAEFSTGARTRSDGSFILRGVPPGEHSILVQAEGSQPLRVATCATLGGQPLDVGELRISDASPEPESLPEIVIHAGQLDTGVTPLPLDAVVVTPSRFLLSETQAPATATLTQSDLLALPQLGDDLYRAISHLPGLAANDLTAQFWVRGATHDRVLARLDGVELVEPFHVKDLDSTLSIVDLETIARMDLYTGGFTADLGNRLVAAISMETEQPSRPGTRTRLGVSLTGARASTRGRARNGRHHWLFSGRSGYPKVALALTGSDDTIEPSYHDVYGKWEYTPAADHRLSFHVLHAGDRLHAVEAAGPTLSSDHRSDYLWARWQGSWGGWLRAETVLAATQLTWHRRAHGALAPQSALELIDERRLRTLGFRHESTAEWQDRLLLHAGFDVTCGQAEYTYRGWREFPGIVDGMVQTNRVSRAASLSPRGTSAGAFLAVRARAGRALVLEAGLRHDANDHAGDRDTSPRIHGVYQTKRTNLRAAWGEYTQAHGLHQLMAGDGEFAFAPSERATQTVFGIEHALPNRLRLRLELYQRTTRRPRVHWENVVDSLAVAPEWEDDRVRFDPVRQRARGIEFIAERRGSTLSWSASYSISQAEETLRSGPTLPLARDQRHRVHVDATYTPNERWQFSLAWQYHTGWPATLREYSALSARDGRVVILNQLGPLRGHRLPEFHRLDLRLQRRVPLRNGLLRLYLDVFNAYDRRNSAGYKYSLTYDNEGLRVTRQPDDNLFPVVPSVGAVWEF